MHPLPNTEKTNNTTPVPPKKIAALFDFDGTLTKKSTVGSFFLMAAGPKSYLKSGPSLVIPTLQYGLKKRTFEEVFHLSFDALLKGKSKEELEAAGRKLARYISKTGMWDDTKQALLKHCREDATVAIVTGGLPFCAQAWLKLEGLDQVYLWASEAEFDAQGYAMGIKNVMVKQQKLKAIEWVNALQVDHIIAYGNSEGDHAMLGASHEKWWVDKKGLLSPWKGVL